ncbi:SRPBCC family protein [Ktedonosporobacter rubrisoli]|uniref:SRPBCC family protein n=1 Tax=Ktedonosporobacter rubrisoli TaxID=2509675 RepID=A0A4P6JX91_KTERU|nr:SRPBCC family protein [Ktedonosporobacter rubrisoli]QBD80244.1 SRPBCC family protein [Ktedonosporobacter rubrisoli]
MAKAYYSTVFAQTADEVWAAIRDFGRYEWASGVTESYMEDGKSGDAVGGVRSFRSNNKRERQRLLAHSDLERFYTFEFCDPLAAAPMLNYQATLRVTPITDGNKAFVEWWGTFDCEPAEQDRRVSFLITEGFPKWLGTLRVQLGG